MPTPAIPETSVCEAQGCHTLTTRAFCEDHQGVLDRGGSVVLKYQAESSRITRPCAATGCREGAMWVIEHPEDPVGIRVCGRHMRIYTPPPPEARLSDISNPRVGWRVGAYHVHALPTELHDVFPSTDGAPT